MAPTTPPTIVEAFEHPPGANERMVALAGFSDDPTALLERAKSSPEVAGLAFNGYRYEIVEDGAGKKHYFLHAWFFDPTASLPLDPNNLNGAPQALFGQTLTAQELMDKQIAVFDTRMKG